LIQILNWLAVLISEWTHYFFCCQFDSFSVWIVLFLIFMLNCPNQKYIKTILFGTYCCHWHSLFVITVVIYCYSWCYQCSFRFLCVMSQSICYFKNWLIWARRVQPREVQLNHLFWNKCRLNLKTHNEPYVLNFELCYCHCTVTTGIPQGLKHRMLMCLLFCVAFKENIFQTDFDCHKNYSTSFWCPEWVHEAL